MTFPASKLAVLVLGVLGALCSPGAEFGFSDGDDPEAAAAMYIAPENGLIFRIRFPNGSIRQLERDLSHPGTLRGADGWRGRFLPGARIEVTDGQSGMFLFERGRLVTCVRAGVTNEFPYAQARPSLPAEDSPLFSGDPERKQGEVDYLADKWTRSGRLQFPFANPNQNGALFALLSLFALWPFFLPRLSRRSVRIASVVLSCAFAMLMVAAASRGAYLGYALGGGLALLFHFRRAFRSRAFVIALLAVAVFAGCWYGLHSRRMITRGFGEKSWSNRIRLELWSAAPRMMADAPGGWGFMNVGHAYLNWYQPTGKWALTGSLMNDHLTTMAALSNPGRFGYLFAWLAALAAAFALALRTRVALPLSALVLFGTVAWFNPTTDRVGLWLAFALVLAPASAFVRSLSLRAYLVCAAFAAVAAGAMLFGLLAYGRATTQAVPIRAEGSHVIAGKGTPQVWIVNDGVALGGVLAGKDVRDCYESVPSAPAVAYANDIAELPKGRVRRLVLAGYAGDAWLRQVCSTPADALVLPQEVVFVSPPFPPEAVPSPLLSSCRVRLVVGEFAARYGDSYAQPPPWVTVVPGSEYYILRWMEYALGS